MSFFTCKHSLFCICSYNNIRACGFDAIFPDENLGDIALDLSDVEGSNILRYVMHLVKMVTQI